MKIAVIASAIALTLVSTAAFAAGGKANQMPKDFGPIYTMSVKGHEMHLQGIKDQDGGEWVVMSKEDAEMLMGSKFESTFQFKEFNAR